MRQDQFTAQHQQQWQALERCLEALEPGPSPDGAPLAEFPRVYREVCQHLALARRRAYSRGLIDRLHRLVLRAHQQYYGGRRPFGHAVMRFAVSGFPRLIREERRFVGVSALLFFGPLLTLLGVLQLWPELVYTVMEPAQVRQFEAMYDPDLAHRVGRERESASDVRMFGFYIRNNTGIGFQTFAGGLLFGIGTLFYLLFNGVYLGAVAGHLTGTGSAEPFWSFVSGHSSLELTAIVFSGAAGLRLGAALLAPGRKTRHRALRDAARVAVRVIYGAAAMFVGAAFVEAFWSSIAWISPPVKYGVGAGLWVLIAAYFLLLGRGRAA